MYTATELIKASALVASMEGRMKEMLLDYSEQYTDMLMNANGVEGKGLSSFLVLRNLAADAVLKHKEELVKESQVELTPEPTGMTFTKEPITDALLYTWFGQNGWEDSAQRIFMEIEALSTALPEYNTRRQNVLKVSETLVKALSTVTTIPEALVVVQSLIKVRPAYTLNECKRIRLFPAMSQPYRVGKHISVGTATTTYHIPSMIVDLPKPKSIKPLTPVTETDLPSIQQTLGQCQHIILVLSNIINREWGKRSRSPVYGAINPFKKNPDLLLEAQTSKLFSDAEIAFLNLYTDPAFIEQHVLFYLDGINRYRQFINMFRRAIRLSSTSRKEH